MRHASRALIKAGDACVLTACGWADRCAAARRCPCRSAASQSAIGDSVQLKVSIRSDGPQPEKLVIDCAVHHVKANGSGTAKVFKGWSLELAPVAERTLVKHPSLRPITTR